MYTASQICQQLQTNDKWLVRGILAIYQRQTSDEQSSQTTKHDNGIGFNGVDAYILSSFAQQIQAWQRGQSRYTSPLSPKQLALARKKMAKYAGQLATIANERVAPAQLAWQRASVATVA